MMYSDHDSSVLKSLLCNAPYASSLAAAASSSSASVYSDSSSQSSDDASSTASVSSASSSESDSCDSYCARSTTTHAHDSCDQQITFSSPQWKQTHAQVDATATALTERRPNPRRTGSGTTTRSGCPPTLVRQSERKVNFVDNLVDSSTQIIETIWPLSSVPCRSGLGGKGVLPLRTFIEETLRRSRTSYSTLQVALYYLILIKPHVPSHDFTMEQPDDVHASRVLQCGRRMFLAALILASKYLQDRNFSARAWSKISGLNTQEINQNEIAFLIAVNWKLHITDEVFSRWTEIVLKLTPHPQPPAPGAGSQRLGKCQGLDWRQVIRKLNPQLDNIEGLVSTKPKPKPQPEPAVFSPRSALPLPQERTPMAVDSSDATPAPKCYITPLVMEPTPAPVHTTPGRFAPALGLLPTPRLTPQSSGYNTPAVSAASLLLNKSSMGLAMAQASSINAAQNLDRWATYSATSSPMGSYLTRRSSLANSVSTASSPESMISDTSRSSSISSTSSLASAPSSKLDVQARCRYAKMCNERYSMRPTIIASVPEDYEENCLTSSPESYTGTVGKDIRDMSLETPLARRGYDIDDLAGATDAARALQELHNAYRRNANAATAPVPSRAGLKRTRTYSADNSLHDNVRDILGGSYPSMSSGWADGLVRSRSTLSNERARLPSPVRGGSKRICCSAEATQGYSRLHPAVGGVGGPGMWKGILD